MKKSLLLVLYISIVFNEFLLGQVDLLTNSCKSQIHFDSEPNISKDSITDFSNFSGLPCSGNTFWAAGLLNLEEFSINGNIISQTGNIIKKGDAAAGIAYCNNLDGGAFSPTFYSAKNEMLFYFDGSTWIKSVISIPDYSLNPGGSGNYLYFNYYNQSTGIKEILKHQGNKFESIYSYFPGTTPTIADLVVDNEGNIWTFTGKDDNKLHTDSLYVISPNGILLYKYPISINSQHGYGSFLINKTLYIGFGDTNPDYPNSILPINIENSEVKLGQIIPFIGSYSDLASCNAGNPLAVNELEEQKEFTIFPNPIKDHINIIIPKNYNEEAYISIYSMSGQKLKDWEFDSLIPLSGTSLNISSLQQGVYILTVTSKTQQSSFKIIKQE